MRVLCTGRSVRLAGALALASALTATLCVVALAAPGDLDRAFGGDGKVGTDFTRGYDAAGGVAVQANGKIVAAGSAGWHTRFALARYKADGKLDPTFSGNGKVTTRFAGHYGYATDLAIQADGKIVAVGDTFEKFAIARYNRNGTLDSSFNRDGRATTTFLPLDGAGASGLAIQPDGRIVVVGYAACQELTGTCPNEEESWEIAVARYDVDGTLDTSFGEGGTVTTDIGGISNLASAVALQADGKIVVAGEVGDYLSSLVRYNQDGTLDPTFGEGGIVTAGLGSPGPERASDLAIQADGKIVTAGRIGSGGFALARYNPDGTPDATFSGDGRVRTDFTPRTLDEAFGVAIQVTGKIVAAGRSGGSFALARYMPDGTLDMTFSGDGRATTNFTTRGDVAGDVALQTNGRIVLAGRAGGTSGRFALARYRGG